MSGQDIASITQICSQLDSFAIEYFEVLSKIYDCNNRLECALRDGYFFMAKARYTMGTRSVGRLQYSEQDLTSAQVRVAVSPCEEADKPKNIPRHFSIVKSIDGKTVNDKTEQQADKTPTTTISAAAGESGLRRRNVGGKDTGESDPQTNSGPEKDDPVSSLITGVEELKMEENKTARVELLKKKPLSDPLRWFGVLTPRVLKDSQVSFSQATELACDLASLQAQLMDVHGKYRSLMADKRRILSPRVETEKVVNESN